MRVLIGRFFDIMFVAVISLSFQEIDKGFVDLICTVYYIHVTVGKLFLKG